MKKVLLVLLLLISLVGCKKNEIPEQEEPTIDMSVDPSSFYIRFKKLINKEYISYENSREFNFDLYSTSYLLYDIDNRNVLFAYNTSQEIYPASLTKLITLDTILNLTDDYSQTSSLSNAQLSYLYSQHASLADLNTNREYSLEELLYGLILPSGADAALALENWVNSQGLDMIEEMNKRMDNLMAKNTYVVNSTGLHDNLHHSCIDDLLLVVRNILKYDLGKQILSTFDYTFSDGHKVSSTLKSLSLFEDVDVHGGKTGYTPQSGQSVMVYYTKNQKDYLIFLTNAKSDYDESNLHFYDFVKVIEEIYN